MTTLLITASICAAPAAKDEVIPVIEMEDVRLTDAIRQLASKARLNIVIDPKLSEPPFDRTTVTFRWERLTAREALDALLDNHGLTIVETRSLSVR
jgi:hypothetical protein